MAAITDPVVAIIDVETTGTNPERDQIIEFAVQKGFGADAFRKSWRVKPSIPIPRAATAIHGISDADVADCPPFSALAPAVRKIIDGSQVIVGYNIEFDLKMLQCEFKRTRQPELDLNSKIVVDPLCIWRRCEPRRLEDAVRRFAGREHTGAHSAQADITATGEVLTAMLKQFKLDHLSWEELNDFQNPEKKNWIGPTHHFQWVDGVPALGFGKHRGTPVMTVAEKDKSYLPWIMGSDFCDQVKEIAKAALEKEPAEFLSWIEARYGQRCV